MHNHQNSKEAIISLSGKVEEAAIRDGFQG